MGLDEGWGWMKDGVGWESGCMGDVVGWGCGWIGTWLDGGVVG